MIDKPITGLVIARFADAHNLSGTQAERLIRQMTPDTRMAVLDLYGEVHDRGVKTSEYYADPDLIEMDRVSAELDQMRQAHRGAGEVPGPIRDACVSELENGPSLYEDTRPTEREMDERGIPVTAPVIYQRKF
jgi:hypothetical protein